MPFERPDGEDLNKRDDAQLHDPGRWAPGEGQPAGQHEDQDTLAAASREDRASDEHHGKDIGDEIDLWL